MKKMLALLTAMLLIVSVLMLPAYAETDAE